MKVGDLVKNLCSDEYGWTGLVLEEEIYKGLPGHWVWYNEDQDSLRWYSFNERCDIEVISEGR